MKNLIILSFIILTLASCEETIELDLDQAPSQIVIRGQVTDQSGQQFVRVSRSIDFYQAGRTPVITDAQVVVTDDLGNTFPFAHNPTGDPSLNGIYFPVADFTGEIGRTYQLRVEADGQVYEASDYLAPILSVDSITYEMDEDEFEDPEDPGKYYNIKLYAKEPQGTVDYYLFRFFANDTLVQENDTDIYYIDDKTLSENIEGVEAPGYYALGDSVSIQIYSLSREAYIFYGDLQLLLTNDGGMFSPPPVNCRTNLSNNALGFFQASALRTVEGVVTE